MVYYRPINKHEFNSAMIGIILGDGSMTSSENGNILYLRHGKNQFEYLDDKVSYLSKYLNPKSIRTSVDKQGFEYKYAYYNTKKLVSLYKLTHNKNVKVITDKLINRFTVTSLAFFYMDDGCLVLRKNKVKGKWTGSYKSREIYLSTHNFSIHEVEKFKNMLKNKFDLDFYMSFDRGKPRLWCNTKNTKKFIELVKPIVSQFPSMSYKLDLKYLKV